MAISKQFIMAGEAIFTVEYPTTEKREAGHFTYRVEKVEANDRWPEAYFVKVFTGTDNTDPTHYTYAGKLDAFIGQMVLTAKSAFPSDAFRVRLLNRVLCRIWGDDQQAIEDAGYKVSHEGKCGRCGRRLTNPVSINTGIGPECAKMMCA